MLLQHGLHLDDVRLELVHLLLRRRHGVQPVLQLELHVADLDALDLDDLLVRVQELEVRRRRDVVVAAQLVEELGWVRQVNVWISECLLSTDKSTTKIKI